MVCGCTDDQACEGGCAWVTGLDALDSDLCTRCAPLRSVPVIRQPGDYVCVECSAVFPVDPADPMDAHGKYLDHLDQHDDEPYNPEVPD